MGEILGPEAEQYTRPAELLSTGAAAFPERAPEAMATTLRGQLGRRSSAP